MLILGHGESILASASQLWSSGSGYNPMLGILELILHLWKSFRALGAKLGYWVSILGLWVLIMGLWVLIMGLGESTFGLCESITILLESKHGL